MQYLPACSHRYIYSEKPTGVSASPPLRRVGNVHTFRGVAGRCSADKGGRRMLVPAQILQSHLTVLPVVALLTRATVE